jgi:CHAD domain-containing protein
VDEQALLPLPAPPPPSNSKWANDVSANQRVGKAARRILAARFKAVWHWLPLAVERSDEDIEHVHQLRISVRRALAALRVFASLLADEVREGFRSKLRQLRLAADGARNWDVLGDRFLHCADEPADDVTAQILGQIHRRRREAQQPLVDCYRDLAANGFKQQIDAVLNALRSARRRRANRAFGQQARRYLRPAVKRFLAAADADLSDDEALHGLRIRTKKLRYTMEIVAVAFAPGFREKLYPRISVLQDVMGTVNDHVTTKMLLRDWLQRSQAVEERAFLRGVLLAESIAHEDVRQEFLAVCTPAMVRRLRRQFSVYCDLP